jgi:uncharacterized protein YsxB (DUF464 family)
MVIISITPAHGGQSGMYRAVGHAGTERICTAVTAIEECLAANLDNTWNIRCRRSVGDGSYELTWNKTDRSGKGLPRANLAAGFAYNGLKALAAEYPNAVRVQWHSSYVERRDRHEN